MDRRRGGRSGASDGLPRTRGDGPRRTTRRRRACWASPHTRGWTAIPVAYRNNPAGFPAHAGMDPGAEATGGAGPRLPRTRGDGPDALMTLRPEDGGFPAHAGMDPARSCATPARSRLPRTRGDGPGHARSASSAVRASPHTRGWTPHHRRHDAGRAGLPRTRGDGPVARTSGRAAITASPHTRGWTQAGRGVEGQVPGFPAHAGMDPSTVQVDSSRLWLPRTRGDGPVAGITAEDAGEASPHTRGWTRAGSGRRPAGTGFPAHAGMDPARSRPQCPPRWLPRTRGDGPLYSAIRDALVAASPHTRGWTRAGAVVLWHP